MRIFFFNNFHNGDLFISKSFVRFIMENYPAEYFYVHGRHPLLLKDLDITTLSGNINVSDKVILNNEEIYINTWIGNYLGHFDHSGCNLKLLYEMFSEIIARLNAIYGYDKKLNSNVEEYIPFIEYESFDVSPVNKFISENLQEKILISNGMALSDQNYNNDDMSEIIKELSQKNPNKLFLITQPISYSADNIIPTSTITNCVPDVNEIGYLSLFCSKIIGRSSGPFTYCMHKDNLNNREKYILCFGNNPVNVIPFEININCNYKYVIDDNREKLKEEIIKLVQS